MICFLLVDKVRRIGMEGIRNNGYFGVFVFGEVDATKENRIIILPENRRVNISGNHLFEEYRNMNMFRAIEDIRIKKVRLVDLVLLKKEMLIMRGFSISELSLLIFTLGVKGFILKLF